MKKMVIIGIIVGIALLTFYHYKVYRADLAWQPYKTGDQLTFYSNNGETVSIEVKEIEKYNNAHDPLSIWPDIHQSIYVNIGKAEVPTLRFTAMSIQLHSGRLGTVVTLDNDIRLEKSGRRSTASFLANPDSLKRNTIIMCDSHKCYQISPIKPKSSLKYVYWNMQIGLMKLEYKDGNIWKLQYFVRNDKELL